MELTKDMFIAGLDMPPLMKLTKDMYNKDRIHAFTNVAELLIKHEGECYLIKELSCLNCPFYTPNIENYKHPAIGCYVALCSNITISGSPAFHNSVLMESRKLVKLFNGPTVHHINFMEE